MSEYPSHEELAAMQDQIAAMHKRLHAMAKQYPNNGHDFTRVALKLTDASWQLDTALDRAKFLERNNEPTT